MRTRAALMELMGQVLDPAAAEVWLDVLVRLGVGFTAATLLVIWALYKGVLVWGKDCDRERKEKEEWKHAALSGTGILEKLTTVVERIESRRL